MKTVILVILAFVATTFICVKLDIGLIENMIISFAAMIAAGWWSTGQNPFSNL
jgi:hypothetical protein